MMEKEEGESHSSRSDSGGTVQNYCQGYLISGHIVYERLALYNGQRLCSCCRAGMRDDYKTAHKRHRKMVGKLHDDVAKFATQNGMEVKCVSDKILLYCRYSVSTFATKTSEENRLRLLAACEGICSGIRGEMQITNKNPRTMAGAVVYVAAILSGTNITQADVVKSLDMTDKTLRENYLFLKPYLKL